MSPDRFDVDGIAQHSMIITTKWGRLLNWETGQKRHDTILGRYENKIAVHSFLNTRDSAWKILDTIPEQAVDVRAFEAQLARMFPKPPSLTRFIALFLSLNLLQGKNRNHTPTLEEENKAQLSEASLKPITLRLTNALRDEESYRKILACPESESQAILDTLQTGVNRLEEFPVAGGTFADIYRGEFERRDVCLKVIRSNQQTVYSRISKIIAREAIFWGQFSHPNLVPFYGLFRNGPELSLVSPWATNGDLAEYLRSNAKVERVLLCSDISEGLNYLHQNEMIHGDLKAANVLIDQSGRACIADFGLSSINDPDILHWASVSKPNGGAGGTTRWQAPELFGIDEAGNVADTTPPNTQASDIYAWACVCLEIFTGNAPFPGLQDTVVIQRVTVQKQKPFIPESAKATFGLSDDMRCLMNDCWAYDPLERPKTANLLSRLAPLKPKDTRPRISFKAGPAMRKDGLFNADVPLTMERLEMILARSPPPRSANEPLLTKP
ncbi:hypothetical protein H0H81_000946 [Sphagnurus paluster]|uniref:Protein kinase domain-containing protein n=1 Tax=Sphagnurus paluster TaxID=117069 RepID=A0A9P7GHB9_9AGAR|nr:hypothetical protein H0H81_000946 [Sphagnurus paluster]